MHESRWSLSIPAEKALAGAQQAALATHASEVQPAHFLFSMLTHGNNLATTVLQKMKWLPSIILTEIAKFIGIGNEVPSQAETEIPLSAECIAMMNNAETEAKRTHSEFVGTEHIFLSMLAAEEKLPIFEYLGITYENGFAAVQQLCSAPTQTKLAS